MTAPSVIRSLHLAEQATAPIHIAGLSKRYGEQRALIDVCFDVRAREVLGLIGPNGAGKTTLLEAIAVSFRLMRVMCFGTARPCLTLTGGTRSSTCPTACGHGTINL
jgi:ABC-type phosphate/phosphonate transport system ATPase subunit